MPTGTPSGPTLAEEFADYALQVKAVSKSHATATFDLDGLILSANGNFLDIFGYTLPEIEGRHHSIFVEPDHRESEAQGYYFSRPIAAASFAPLLSKAATTH